MAIRIVLLGSDRFNRVAALRSKGYAVDECYSVAELHSSLVGVLPTDAIAIAESDAAVIDSATSLARAISAAPLILFENGAQHPNPGEFDLLIPANAAEQHWLSDIAQLVARTSKRNR